MDDNVLYSTAAHAIESGDCGKAYQLLKPKDVTAGMALIRVAADEGVEDAIEFLRP
jgi:hypothetical protein